MTSLSHMPEEILERILDLAVAPAFLDSTPRPAWQSRPRASSRTGRDPFNVSILLVNHTWLRVATPLHYRRVVLGTPRHAALFAATLAANPELGRWVRAVRVDGTYDSVPHIVVACPDLLEFDMVVDNGSPVRAPGASTPEAEAAAQTVANEQVARFCASFEHMPRLRHLVVRKNAYLTQARPILVFEQLGKAVATWKGLVSLI